MMARRGSFLLLVLFLAFPFSLFAAVGIAGELKRQPLTIEATV